MSDYDGGFDERPHMSDTAQDALRAQGELVKKNYENKIARLERKLAIVQTQRDKAVAALKHYGQHVDGCMDNDSVDCICGYTTALKECGK